MRSLKLLVALLLIFSSQSLSAQTVGKDWFKFSPNEDFSPTTIDCNNWLHKPAGKHGFVQIIGDKFEFEDGTIIKFWGVNICSAKPYSNRKTIDDWVKFLAKYGVNAVRFHKFTAHGMPDDVSTKLADEKLQQMDYFHYRLKETGIYYGWSPIYGHKPRPGDKDRLLAYDEIAKADMNSHLSYSTIGLVNFAEDLQDLHIDLVVSMLNHKNPHTGLRYAQDPALAFVELQNEDNIYFATSLRMANMCPTYKKLLCQKFSIWLKREYGTRQNLEQAWGDYSKFVENDWNMEALMACPVISHGVYDWEYKEAYANNRPMPRCLLDMAYFLYLEQWKFYDRFIKAIRQTGYKGPIVGSCWQAGSGPTHYYNLHTDYLAGIIDRHAYFGGGTGHNLKPGNVKHEPMTAGLQTGLLTSGMQQMATRPFALSEWISKMPNQWIAEGAPIVAAYGMGLQGWDASYEFASNHPFFSETINSPNSYNVNSPTQIALYPALARMVYRQDVKEADIIASRNVHIPSLRDSKLGFYETVSQTGDFKEFKGIVPNEALAVGRVVLNFTDKFEDSQTPDLSAYLDSNQQIIRSSTGQLSWHYADKGYISINTAGTQGCVGFTKAKELVFDDLKLRIATPFAVVLVSSLEKDKSIAESKNLLITTVARAYNSGMVYNQDGSKLLDAGQPPIMIEPVLAELELHHQADIKVHVLDHVGRRTGKTIKSRHNRFKLDGRKHQAIYYEVEIQ